MCIHSVSVISVLQHHILCNTFFITARILVLPIIIATQLSGDTVWLVIQVSRVQIFAKRAKIRVSEIFAVLFFASGESATRGLIS